MATIYCGLILNSESAKNLVDLDNKLNFAIKLKDVYCNMYITKLKQLDIIDAAILKAKETMALDMSDNLYNKFVDIVGDDEDYLTSKTPSLRQLHDKIFNEINGTNESLVVDDPTNKVNDGGLDLIDNDKLSNNDDPYKQTNWTEKGLRNAVIEIRDTIYSISLELTELMESFSKTTSSLKAVDNSRADASAINYLINKLNSALTMANQALFDIASVEDKTYVDDDNVIDLNAHECETEDLSISRKEQDVREDAEIIELIAQGGTVDVRKDVNFSDGPAVINGDTELNFHGKTLTTTGDERGNALVINGGNVVLKNMTVAYNEVEVPGNPLRAGIIVAGDANVTLENVNCHEEIPVAIRIEGESEGATVTINSGDFTTEKGSQSAYVIFNGKSNKGFVINGGKFGAVAYEGKSFCLNCKDDTFKEAAYGKEMKDVKLFEVKGGEFVGFDPANNNAEPLHAQKDEDNKYAFDTINWVAEGYHVENEGDVYKVVKD